MSKTFEQQLKALKSSDQLTPDQIWVSKTRDRLAAQRAQKQVTEKSILDYVSAVGLLFPQSLLRSARSLAVFVLVFAIAVGGWGISVSAAQNSMPGDLLYLVKLAHEKQEVRRANTDKDRVEVLLKQASTRVNELEKLQDEQRSKKKKLSREEKKKHTETVLASLKEKIETTNETLEKARQENGAQTIEVAKVVEEKTERIEEQMRESIEGTKLDEGTDDLGMEDSETEEAVEDVVALVEETNVKAVVVTIQSILNGNEITDTHTANAEEYGAAEQKVTKKIQELEKILAQIQKKIHLVDNVATGTTFTMTLVSSTATATTPFAESTVPSIAVSSTVTGTESMPEQTKRVSVAGLQENVDTVEKELREVKALVEEKNLQEAIQKVEALYSLKNIIKEQVDEAKKTKTMTVEPGEVVPVPDTISITSTSVEAGTSGTASGISSTTIISEPQDITSVGTEE